jgi:hypothetical protein
MTSDRHRRSRAIATAAAGLLLAVAAGCAVPVSDPAIEAGDSADAPTLAPTTPASPGGATTSGRPTAAADAGHTATADGAAPDGASAGGASPDGAARDAGAASTTRPAEQAATEALRSWKRAIADGDLEAAVARSRAEARWWSEVTRVVAAVDARNGHPHRFTVWEDDLHAAQVSSERVSFAGGLRIREEADTGLDRGLRLTDLVVTRGGDSWAVETFVMDGVPLAWRSVGFAQRTAGVRMELLAVVSDSASTWAVTRVSVPADERRQLDPDGGTLIGPAGRSYLLASAFTAEAAPVGVWRFPHSPEASQLTLRLREGGEVLEFSYPLP